MSIKVGLTIYGSSFKNRHFVRSETLASRAKDSVRHNNTIKRLSIILYYSLSLSPCECLICQIYQ